MGIFPFCMNAQAFKHYTLIDADNDTIAYLQKNFIDQKTYFIGKPFSKLLDVFLMDLPLNYAAATATSPWENTTDDSEYINGIKISWFTKEEAQTFVLTDWNRTIFLNIVFQPPYTEWIWSTQNTYDTVQKMTDHLKHYVIQDVYYKH